MGRGYVAGVIDVTTDGAVTVVRMDDEENRFSPDMLAALEGALASLEAAEGPRALVTTGTGKFWSNGLDLDWMGANPDELVPYIGRIQALFARVLELPCPTVAALNGHCFAAGAMLSLCHDAVVMRDNRGYWCLPEVDLSMPFTPGMNALIPSRLPARTAHEAMVTGRRYPASEALAAGIVDEVAAEADVVPRAVARAQALAHQAGPNLGGIRSHLHAEAVALLRGEERA